MSNQKTVLIVLAIIIGIPLLACGGCLLVGYGG